MSILLSNNGYHKWKRASENDYYRGWIEYKDGAGEEEFKSALTRINTAEELSSLLLNVYGNISVIIQRDNRLIAATDNISSFPLFYSKSSGELIISDSLSLLRKRFNSALDQNQKQLFYSCGFSLGNKTVYSSVYQIEAGQILDYSQTEDEIRLIDYYVHKHADKCTNDSDVLCKKLDECVLNIMRRMLRSIEGRPIVLFLSGGYDSKLILSTLRRLNYEDVTCVSLGGMDTKDVSVAKEIASTLNYKWIRLDVDQKYWKKFRKSTFCQNYFETYAAFGARPYLQGVTITTLIESGDVAPNCVVLSGNSGDAIEGADVTHMFEKGKVYNKADILESIRFKHFTLNGYKESQYAIQKVDIDHYSKYITDKDQAFTDEECEDIFELFNWRERQCKYVVNDIHNYEEVLNLDWRLPLWDREFQDFWLNVAYDQRYDRKLYYEYVKAERLPTANDISLARKGINAVKKTLGRTINLLYIPKSLWNYKFSSKYYYATYGLLSFRELLSILKTSSGNREPHMEGIVRIMYSYF